MDLLFGGDFDYDRGGLVLVAVGMGLYLSAATLNQALLAHARAPGARPPAGRPARRRSCSSSLLVEFDDRVLQVEVAFTGAAALLAGSLYALYRRA